MNNFDKINIAFKNDNWKCKRN